MVSSVHFFLVLISISPTKERSRPSRIGQKAAGYSKAQQWGFGGAVLEFSRCRRNDSLPGGKANATTLTVSEVRTQTANKRAAAIYCVMETSDIGVGGIFDDTLMVTRNLSSRCHAPACSSSRAPFETKSISKISEVERSKGAGFTEMQLQVGRGHHKGIAITVATC